MWQMTANICVFGLGYNDVVHYMFAALPETPKSHQLSRDEPNGFRVYPLKRVTDTYILWFLRDVFLFGMLIDLLGRIKVTRPVACPNPSSRASGRTQTPHFQAGGSRRTQRYQLVWAAFLRPFWLHFCAIWGGGAALLRPEMAAFLRHAIGLLFCAH